MGGLEAPTLGHLLLELRKPAEAAAVLEGGLAAAARNGDRQAVVRCLGQLAWARQLLGAAQEARTLAARTEAILEQTSGPPGSAFLRLHRHAGRADEAEEHAAMAHAIVERLSVELNDESLRDGLRAWMTV